MKNLIITILVSAVALVNVQAKDVASIEACKTYIKEAQNYQSTMKSGYISEATFAFYKDKVVSHCGNIAAKMPYQKNYFAQALMKKNRTSVHSCKTAIKMAQSYDNSTNKSAFITHAHKTNIADNCGTLVAKKAPSFCLFDVIDESKKDIKDRCLASVKRAHAFQSTNSKDVELVQSHKDEIRANCGTLMAKS